MKTLIPWDEDSRQERVSRETKTSQRASLSRRASVRKVMLVIIGTRLSDPIIKKEGCKLWNKYAFKHTEQAGGDPMKRHNSAVVAKTLDISSAGTEIISHKSRAKGDLPHCVSGIPVESILREVGEAVVRKFRLSRVAKRCVQEREKKGTTLGITQ